MSDLLQGMTQAQSLGVLAGFAIGLVDYFLVVHVIGDKLMKAAEGPGASPADRLKAANGMAFLKPVTAAIAFVGFPAIGYFAGPVIAGQG